MKTMTKPIAIVFLLCLLGSFLLWTGCTDDSSNVSSPTDVTSPTQEVKRTHIPVDPDQVRPINRPFNPINFEDGTIATSTIIPQEGIHTELTLISDGTVLATLDWSVTDQTLIVDVVGVTSGTVEGYEGSANPFGCNTTLYYVYQNVLAAQGNKSGEKDEPGCDRIPDWLETECMLDCCEVHDKCFADNNCTERSWLPGHGEGLACTMCNVRVVDCMVDCLPWWVPRPWWYPGWILDLIEVDQIDGAQGIVR
ncbi:MAG: hypothetical protein GY780_04155 [bacterium]|nr:hypothetical protein [bacterium]